MSNSVIRLGDEVEDVTAKFIGIAIARVEYLSGAVCWIIQPFTSDDNEMIRSQEIPEAYCRRIGDGVHVKSKPMIGFRANDEV